MSAGALAAAAAGIALAAALVEAEGAWLRATSGARGTVGPGRAIERRALVRALRGGGVLAHLAAGAGATAVAALLVAPVPALLCGLLVAAGSVVRARRRAGSGRRLRERGAPLLARSLADALRGGASVRGALTAAADDRSVPPALRAAAGQVAGAVRLGAPLGAGLRDLATEGGGGLRLLCGTVALHLEAGGALAGELERLAVEGEAALRIDEERVAATAQARATVRVVAALPLLALLGAQLASRDFLSTIAGHPIAIALLAAGLLLEAAAIVVARAIVGPSR